MSEPSPQCKISLGNKAFAGIVRSRTSNPVFEESFNFFVLDCRQEALELSVPQIYYDRIINFKISIGN